VKVVRAHVHNGQIVLDDPLDLPEGAAVEVLLPEVGEPSAEAPADLEAALEESTTELERGELEDARAFALRLVARSRPPKL
jgi:hypothetical protein